MSIKVITAVFILSLSTWAQSLYHTPHILWRPSEILIHFQGEYNFEFEPGAFCQTVITKNLALKGSTCRISGDMDRDSSMSIYFQWLSANIGLSQSPQFLAARSPQVIQRLKSLDDRTLLFLNHRSDTLWAALFVGSRSHLIPSPQATPIALAYQVQVKTAQEISNWISDLWFSGKAQRKLSDREKQESDIAPHEQFAEAPFVNSWIGVSYGNTQAHIPLTPNSWTSGKQKSSLRNYRAVQDSLSYWNILDDQSPLYGVRTGFTWRGFIGAELFALYSKHSVKLDPTDTIYNELDHWSFTRYEIGLTAHVTHNRPLGPTLLWQPYAFIGFHYSFLQEDIQLKTSVSPSDAYRYRIEFMPFYKGTVFGVGQRLIWNKKISLEARTGLNNRGRSLDQEPSMDEVREPTIIGGSTLDWFISTALEYHWSWKQFQ